MNVPDSPRLGFEFVTEAHAEFLWEVDQDEAVMQYINGGRKSSLEDIHGVFIPRMKAYANEPLGWGLWQVKLQDSPAEAIGWVLVRPMGFFTPSPVLDNLELGWRFKRAYWGQGYATEAAKAVRDSLFETGVRKFSAIALPENAGSIGVMKKLGMTFSHDMHYKDSVFDEQVVVYSQHL